MWVDLKMVLNLLFKITLFIQIIYKLKLCLSIASSDEKQILIKIFDKLPFNTLSFKSVEFTLSNKFLNS